MTDGNPPARHPDDPFDFGDCVRILGSAVTGFVTAVKFSMRRDPVYDVEYIDAQGNPQEREWSHGQLFLIREAEAMRQDMDDSAQLINCSTPRCTTTKETDNGKIRNRRACARCRR